MLAPVNCAERSFRAAVFGRERKRSEQAYPCRDKYKPNKAWTRSGGGDSDAIKQMVTYAIGKYSANPNHVYSTGDSSGGTRLVPSIPRAPSRSRFGRFRDGTRRSPLPNRLPAITARPSRVQRERSAH